MSLIQRIKNIYEYIPWFVRYLLLMAVIIAIFVGSIGAYIATPLIPYIKMKFISKIGESWSSRGMEKTQNRGDLIISALERYRDSQGNYPVLLDDLAPVYIDTIEPPAVGEKQWSYSPMLNHPDEYHLSVESKYADDIHYLGIIFYSYNSIDKKWETVEEHYFDD